MKNFDFLYNTVICSYLLMKKLTVLLALRHFSWLVSLTPLQASTWLPCMADWLRKGCRGCFVGACSPEATAVTPAGNTVGLFLCWVRDSWPPNPIGDERDSVCCFCGVVNRRKRLINCDTCGCLFHLSCVGLTRAQAEAFMRWNCEQCQGVARVPTRAETPPIDLVGYIGRCRHSLRVLNHFPKGAVIPVPYALQRLINEALNRDSEASLGLYPLAIGVWGAR